MKKIFVILIICFGYFSSLYSDSPYNISLKTDLSITAGGIGLLGVGFYTENTVKPYTADEVAGLQNNVNSVDRIATEQWSEGYQDASNYLLYSSFLLPGVLFSGERVRENYGDILFLYFESYIYSISINKIVKGIVKRDRPYLYNNNPEISESLKEDIDARRSFYSGHTNLAFTASILTAKIYCDFYPESKYKGLVWGSAILFGSAMGFFRVAGGMHYPSDVIAGAVIGGAIGYLVPELHKKTGVSASANSNGIMLGFAF